MPSCFAAPARTRRASCLSFSCCASQLWGLPGPRIAALIPHPHLFPTKPQLCPLPQNPSLPTLAHPPGTLLNHLLSFSAPHPPLSFPASSSTPTTLPLRHTLTYDGRAGAGGSRAHLGPICTEKRWSESAARRGRAGEGEERGLSQAGCLPVQEASLQPEHAKTWHLHRKLARKSRPHPIPFLELPCCLRVIPNSIFLIRSIKQLRYLTLLELSPGQETQVVPVYPAVSALPEVPSLLWAAEAGSQSWKGKERAEG